jgi:DNA polymerase-3 subunit alpha
LAREFEAIGFYLSAHPLDAYQATLNRVGVKRYSEMMRMLTTGDQMFKVAGTVISRQERTSQKGKRFAFVGCSDASGMFEVTVFSELLAQHRDWLEPGRNVVWTMTARLEGEQARLTAQKVELLDDVAARAAAGIRIVIDDAASLPKVQELLKSAGRGRGQVMFGVEIPGRGLEADIKLPALYAVNPQLRGQIRILPGVVEVYDI